MKCTELPSVLQNPPHHPIEKRLLAYVIAVLVCLVLLTPTEVSAGPLFPEPCKPVRTESVGLATADLDNDGHLDLIVPSFDYHEMEVHLGRGDGSFTTLVLDATDDHPTDVLAEDFDGDGNADLALSKYDLRSLSIRMGNGDGTFGSETDYNLGDQLWSVDSGDFNGDGKVDLLGMGSDGTLLLGSGDGTFAAYDVPGRPWRAGVADFDGDDLDDYAYGYSGTIRVMTSNGDGTFDLAASLIPGEGTENVAAGDISEDGIPDLVAANAESDDISVFIGNGDGTFQPEQRLALGHPPGTYLEPRYLAIDDLDRDGLQDVIVSNYWTGVPMHSLSIFYGTGGGTLSAPVTTDTMTGFGYKFVLGDFNEDSATDLARGSFIMSYVKWLFGDGEGEFVTNRTESIGEDATDVATVDLDGDGRIDVVVLNRDTDDLSILMANGAGTFAPEARSCLVDSEPPCPSGSGASALAIGNLTDDGDLDLAVTNAGTDTVSILAGDGAGHFSFVTSLTTLPGMEPSSISIGDLDNDDIEDLVTVGQGSTVVGVYLGNGDGTFHAPPPGFPTQAGTNPAGVAMGHFDADTDLDVVVANRGSNTITVLLGSGNGRFTLAPLVDAGGKPTGIAVGDLNQDGVEDIAVAHDFPQTIHVYLGIGDGTFAAPTVLITRYQEHNGPSQVSIADFDGDGRPDVSTATGRAALWVFPGNGDGTFREPGNYVISGNVFDVGDFDLDARLDLISAGTLDSAIVLLNQTGPKTLNFEEGRATLSWPAVIGALSYDIYRGDLSDVIDSDGNGIPDSGYGSCMTGLDDDARDTYFVDTETPSPGGEGFFYLVEAVDSAGKTGLGASSAGLPRIPAAPCP